MYTRKKPAIDSFPIDLKIEKYFYCYHADYQIAARKITGQFQAFMHQLRSDYGLETKESNVRSYSSNLKKKSIITSIWLQKEISSILIS